MHDNLVIYVDFIAVVFYMRNLDLYEKFGNLYEKLGIIIQNKLRKLGHKDNITTERLIIVGVNSDK